MQELRIDAISLHQPPEKLLRDAEWQRGLGGEERAAPLSATLYERYIGPDRSATHMMRMRGSGVSSRNAASSVDCLNRLLEQRKVS